MNLQEEFQETVLHIRDDLKRGSSKLLSKTMKDLERDPEAFMLFYSVVMDSTESLEIEIYKGLLPPLNTLQAPQEISRLYIKIISVLLEDKSDEQLLEFINLIYSHSLPYLKSLFNTPSFSALTTSLIMFGEFLFLKKWYYECYKVLYVASQSVVVMGVCPTKDVMSKYLGLVCVLLLRENNFYFFLNGLEKLSKLDRESVEKFGSRAQLEMLSKYCEYKNEGMEHSQLLCRMPYLSLPQIHDFIKKVESTREDGFVSEYVDFTKWEMYRKTVGGEIEIHDLSFVSFLKRNNFSFEIEEKKVKVGEYKFRSISDTICDIIEKYKAVEEVVKPKKRPQPVAKEVVKHQPQKKKSVKFRDHFVGKKAKLVVYCEILSKNYKERDMKNEERDRNRRKQFEKWEEEEENRRNQLLRHQETLQELREEINKKIRETSKWERSEETYKPPTLSKTTRVNWRDIEIDESVVQRSSPYGSSPYGSSPYGNSFYKQKGREDILASRTISSFENTPSLGNTPPLEKTENEIYKPPSLSKFKIHSGLQSNDQQIYRPPLSTTKLKIFERTSERGTCERTGEKTSERDGQQIYRPPLSTTRLKIFDKEIKNKEDEKKVDVYVPPHRRKEDENNKDVYALLNRRKEDSTDK